MVEWPPSLCSRISVKVSHMLVNFSLRNYKSFKSECNFEMSPGTSRSKTHHVKNDCLNIATIYGYNASGKSNLIHGIKTMKMLLTDPFYCGREPLGHWESTDDTTWFCMEFTIGKLQYRYELEVISERVVDGGTTKQMYMYPVKSERISYTDLRYESDKNGNVVYTPILNRESDIFHSNNEIVKFLHRIRELTTGWDNYRTGNINREIKLQKELVEISKTNTYEKQTENLVKKRNAMYRKRYLLRKELESIKHELHSNLEFHNTIPSTLLLGKMDNISEDMKFHLKNIIKWLKQSLYILDTNDIYFPNIDNSLDSISNTINKMDLGIDYLEWKRISDYESKNIMEFLPIKDIIFIQEKQKTYQYPFEKHTMITKTKKGIYRIVFDYVDLVMFELVPKGKHCDKSSLYSESDGTVRMIELASMLSYTEDDVTFIVDEMDRRLHPMLTREIVKTYLEDKSPCKQLVFTTHETEILTTDLFRKDEIWFVQKINGESHLVSLDVIPGLNYNKRLEKLYLEDIQRYIYMMMWYYGKTKGC